MHRSAPTTRRPSLILHIPFGLLLLALALALTAVPAAAANLTYEVIALGAGNGSSAIGLNNGNEVTGQTGSGQVFRWTEAGGLAPLVGPNGQGLGINDAGTVVGFVEVAAPVPTAFQQTAGGAVTPLPQVPGAFTSTAFRINANGEIVGVSGGLSPIQATFWGPGGAPATGLGTFGAAASYGYGLNDTGLLVGEFGQVVLPSDLGESGMGFVYDLNTNTKTDLNTLGGAMSVGVGVNNANQVVGWADRADGLAEAFLWQGGTMTGLGKLGGRESFALAVNEAGHVVGGVEFVPGQRDRAFLYTPGMGMTALNDLIGPQAAAWDIVAAFDINEAGWIVGDAHNAAGERVAVLLRPNATIPEPGTWAVLCLAGVWVKRRRR